MGTHSSADTSPVQCSRALPFLTDESACRYLLEDMTRCLCFHSVIIISFVSKNTISGGYFIFNNESERVQDDF